MPNQSPMPAVSPLEPPFGVNDLAL